MIRTHEIVDAGVVGRRRVTFEYLCGPDPAFICFSGAASDSIDWRALAAEMAGKRALLCVNKPGFLGSTPAADYSVDRLVDDVIDVCRSLDIRRANACGHSFGALPALALADRRPASLKVLAVLSVDGVTLNASSAEVLARMSPSVGVQAWIARAVMSAGVLSLTPKLDDYPRTFRDRVGESEFRRGLAIRRRLWHKRAVGRELLAVPTIARSFGVSLGKLEVPYHDLRAVSSNRPLEDSNEAAAFPELIDLLRREAEEADSWIEANVRETGGTRNSIESEHFVQWTRPRELAEWLLDVSPA